jgi:hypothetical protein
VVVEKFGEKNYGEQSSEQCQRPIKVKSTPTSRGGYKIFAEPDRGKRQSSKKKITWCGLLELT